MSVFFKNTLYKTQRRKISKTNPLTLFCFRSFSPNGLELPTRHSYNNLNDYKPKVPQKFKYTKSNEAESVFTFDDFDTLFDSANEDNTNSAFDEEDKSPNSRLKTPTGVEILPKIEEESEPEEEIARYYYRASVRRLTRISWQFEDLIMKSNVDRNNTDIVLNVENFKNIDNQNKGRKGGRFLKMTKTNRLIKSNFGSFCSTVTSELLRPLYLSLKSPYFIPALAVKGTVESLAFIYIILVPYIALVYEIRGYRAIAEIETAFLLSLIAFSWWVFLMIMTWIIDNSKVKLRILNVCALLLGSFCYFRKFIFVLLFI